MSEIMASIGQKIRDGKATTSEISVWLNRDDRGNGGDVLEAAVKYLLVEAQSNQFHTANDEPLDLESIKRFVKMVNEKAERNMQHTGVVSGAHWNAMKSVLREIESEATT